MRLLITILLIFVFYSLQGQNPLIKETQLEWNGDFAKWKVISEENWHYDGEILIYYNFSQFSFSAKEKSLLNSKSNFYDLAGNITLKVDSFRYSNQDRFYVEETNFIYDEDKLIEEVRIDLSENVLLKQKINEYNSKNQLINTKLIERNVWDDLILKNEQSFQYNDKGCLIEQIDRDTNPSLDFSSYDKTVFDVNENCEVLAKYESSKFTNGDFSLGRKCIPFQFYEGENLIGGDSIFNWTYQNGQGFWKYLINPRTIQDQNGNQISK